MRPNILLALLLLCGVASASDDPAETAPSPERSCVATLPGARLGTQGGYCHETLVANTDDDTVALPLVIGFHWSGSTPREFREVLAGIRRPVRLVLVQGRQPRREGFSFYPVDPYYYGMDAAWQRDAQRAESERLVALARALAEEYRTCGRPVVVGASQGGDLGYLIGLRHPEVVGLAIPLMATIDPALIPDAPSRSIPIRAMHGVDDAIVPIATARSLADASKAKGFDVQLAEFEGVGHDVPTAMRSALAKVIDAHLAEIECKP